MLVMLELSERISTAILPLLIVAGVSCSIIGVWLIANIDRFASKADFERKALIVLRRQLEKTENSRKT